LFIPTNFAGDPAEGEKAPVAYKLAHSFDMTLPVLTKIIGLKQTN